MINDQKKEEIRDAADIVEVVGDVVRLKRSGSGFSGLCPFHNEKTPSFHVTPNLRIYKCFGCGKTGDVFNFLMETEGLSFPEALRTLAERYNVDIPEDSDEGYHEVQQEKEGIYHALKMAGLYYHRQLRESDEAEEARNILHERGFDTATQREFGLGYAPGGGDQLLQEARREGLDEHYLLAADLIKPSQRGEGYYDTFRNRLMFPIMNTSGKVIAFGGRIIGNNKRTAKYVNSAQTEVYNKSDVLFGLNFAKNEIRREGSAILVEGYTDVITMHQSGIKNTISSSGTALTPAQIRLLKRFTNKLLMIYDADDAGQKAMERGIQTALEGGMDLTLLTLPDNEDPDTYVRQFGRKAFDELKSTSAQDFVTFLIRRAEETGGLDQPANRAKLIQSVIALISRMPNAIEREVFVKHLHQKTQSFRRGSDRELFEELQRQLAQREEEAKRSRLREARQERGRSLQGPEHRSAGEFVDGRSEQSMGAPPDFGRFSGFGLGSGSRMGFGSGQGTESPGPPASDPRFQRGEGPPLRGEYRETGLVPGTTASPSTRKKRPGYEKDLLRLLIIYGEGMRRFVGHNISEEYFEDGELRAFYADIMQRHVDGSVISVEHYTGREHPYPSMLGDILLERYGVSSRSGQRTGQEYKRDKNPVKSAKSVMRHLRMAFFERRRLEISDKLRSVSSEEERRAQVQLLSRLQKEVTRLQKMTPDELYEDPEFLKQGNGAAEVSGRAFQYEMKKRDDVE